MVNTRVRVERVAGIARMSLYGHRVKKSLGLERERERERDAKFSDFVFYFYLFLRVFDGGIK